MLVNTNTNKIPFVPLSCRRNEAPPTPTTTMTKTISTRPVYKMLVMQCWLSSTFPMIDYAHEVNGQWVSLNSGKTVADLNNTGEFADPIKLVSLAYGHRLCRKALKEEALKAEKYRALPASYYATRERRAARRAS